MSEQKDEQKELETEQRSQGEVSYISQSRREKGVGRMGPFFGSLGELLARSDWQGGNTSISFVQIYFFYGEVIESLIKECNKGISNAEECLQWYQEELEYYKEHKQHLELLRDLAQKQIKLLESHESE